MIFALIYLIWLVYGLAAFIASIVCLSYKGSTGAKTAGFLLALFFGPFYWLFYMYSSNYCVK